tara:strand:- start:5539 stop:6210 length:672 start_codon:yes stop_codon:yes gene_type:complete
VNKTDPDSLGSIGMLETTGFTPAMVALDMMSKTAEIQVLQAEVNDFLGICIKIFGDTASVEVALAAGVEIAERMEGKPVIKQLFRPDSEALKVINGQPEFNPLIQQDVVHLPKNDQNSDGESEPIEKTEESTMANNQALGFIETQGFTAVFNAIDTACKAANVEVIGKEKLGGGYITVVLSGDVAAVSAAVEAGEQAVQSLGTLIASHVIPRPTDAVVKLLPQ